MNDFSLGTPVVAVGIAVSLVAAFFIARAMMARPKDAPSLPSNGTRTSRNRALEASLPSLGEAEADDEVTKMGKVPSIARAEQDAAPKADVAEDEDEEVADVDDNDFTDDSDEHTGPRALILVTAVARTDVGKHRTNNEDNLLVLPEEPLFVVADGMGGYAGGEVASKMAVDVIGQAFTARTFPGMRRRTRYRRANELLRAIELANAAVLEKARASSEHKDMGTTIAATRFSPSKRRVYVANVGDSRVCRVRDRALTQLTTDHTLAVEAGVKGSMGAQLSRAVGVIARVKPDVRVEDAFPGDYYLICSDGLTKMVSDDQIRDEILAHGSDLEKSAQELIAKANSAGGRDNVTVILIRVDEASLRVPGPTSR